MNLIVGRMHGLFSLNLPLDFLEDDAIYWALYFCGLQLGNQTFVEHLLNKLLFFVKQGHANSRVFNDELKPNLFV